MRLRINKFFTPIVQGCIVVLGVLMFCAIVGYTFGRFVEVVSVQHVYSVSTPVTYMHERGKDETTDEYDGTIAADRATINYLVNVFSNESAKLKEFKMFSQKYNTQISYQMFENNISLGEDSSARKLLFIAKSSNPELANHLSRSYAEDAVSVIQKVSDTASIDVKLDEQITSYDTYTDRKFGMIFMYLGLAVGLTLSGWFWFQDKQRRIFFKRLIERLNEK